MAQKTRHVDCPLLTRLYKFSTCSILDGDDDQPDETVLAQDMEELSRERPRHRPVLRICCRWSLHWELVTSFSPSQCPSPQTSLTLYCSVEVCSGTLTNIKLWDDGSTDWVPFIERPSDGRVGESKNQTSCPLSGETRIQRARGRGGWNDYSCLCWVGGCQNLQNHAYVIYEWPLLLGIYTYAYGKSLVAS